MLNSTFFSTAFAEKRPMISAVGEVLRIGRVKYRASSSRMIDVYDEETVIVVFRSLEWLDIGLIEQLFKLNSDSKLTAEGLAAELSVARKRAKRCCSLTRVSWSRRDSPDSRWAMSSTTCSAVGCTNNPVRNPELRYHQFVRDRKRHKHEQYVELEKLLGECLDSLPRSHHAIDMSGTLEWIMSYLY
ncbi:hypothetical protein HPB47_005124 [Ixodes persulcatus]|uniref:Uncharacterized protein n=1 Tax=Ixodes persulcatus TaxID=34615 RepID=A0AC60PE19_IXOPE|nr:hypothetical protein HPB47_005124 [Ixodes persulcatus]